MKLSALFLYLIFSLSFSALQAGELSLIAADIAPYSFINAKGEVDGIVARKFQTLAKKVNSSEKIQVLPLTRALSYKSHTAIIPLARTPERENLFQWVVPLFEDKFVFMKKKKTKMKISSLEDAKKYSITTLNGSSTANFLKANNFPNVEFDNTNVTCAKKLHAERNELWFAAYESAKTSYNHAGFSADELEIAFVDKPIQLYLVFSLDVPKETVQKWQSAYQELKSKEGIFPHEKTK